MNSLYFPLLCSSNTDEDYHDDDDFGLNSWDPSSIAAQILMMMIFYIVHYRYTVSYKWVGLGWKSPGGVRCICRAPFGAIRL